MSNPRANPIEPKLQSARPLRWAIFVFFLALYVMITPRGEWTYSADNERMFWVCQSIAEDGDINLLNQGLEHARANKNDTSRVSEIRSASEYPLLPSLVGIPFYVAGKWVARLVGRPLDDNGLFVAASLSGSFISALTCLLLFQFILVMGFGPKTAFFATCCYGMGTIVFYQAPYLDTEPINTLALLGTVYSAYLYKTKGRYYWVYLCGLFSGVAAASRDVSILIVPPVLVYLLATAWEKAKDAPLKSKLVGGLRHLFIFLPGLLPFLVLNLWYTFARYGLPHNVGYTGLGGDVWFFSNPLLVGLYGFLFSPGQSLFLSCPVLVLGFFSIKSFCSKYKAESILIFSIFLVHLLVYAKTSFWPAGVSFGPRYLLPTIPLLVLPMAPFLETLPTRSFLIKVFVLLIFCLGVTIETAQFWGSRSPRWQAELQVAEKVGGGGKAIELSQYLPEAHPFLWTGPADMTWLDQFYFVSPRWGYIRPSILLILLATIVGAGAYLAKKLRLLPDATDLRSFAARVGAGIRGMASVFFSPKRIAYTGAILLVLASAAYASFKYVLVPLKQYNSRPFGAIESPVIDYNAAPTLTGKIEVTGWTLDRSGIRAVEIHIDDVKVADAKYGEPSPEVADLFPYIPNSERARFVATGIDTASFSNGIHILVVKALSHKGVWADTEALAAIFVNDPHYNFWSHLGEADPNAVLADTVLTINQEPRRVLLQPPGSEVTFKNVPIYKGARLKLGIGIIHEGEPKDSGAIVLEVVANANIPLFSTRIDSQAYLAEQTWHDDLIDLRQFSNQAISLTLIAKTESGDDTPSIRIGWSSMDLIYPDEEENPESTV